MAVMVMKYDSRYNNLYIHELSVKYQEKDNAGHAYDVITEFCKNHQLPEKRIPIYCDHSPAIIRSLTDRKLWAENAEKKSQWKPKPY